MDIISILTGALTFLITITGYFIKRHIETIETEVKSMRSELSALKQDNIWLTNASGEMKSMLTHNTKEVQASLVKLSAKMDNITDANNALNDRLKNHEKHLENYGQVIRLLASKK